MSGRFRAALLPDSDYDLWDRLVSGAEGGSIYHTAQYLDMLCEAAGGRFEVLGLFKGDELLAGIPLYQRADGQEAYVAPRLLLYYNGPVVRHAASRYPSKRTSLELNVLSSALDWFEAQSFGRVTLRGGGALHDIRAFLSRAWEAVPKYSYLVLLDEPSAVWERIDQNLRRLVGRCEQLGVVATVDDDFESFFGLHEATMDRRGHGPYLPRDTFRTFASKTIEQGMGALIHARTPTGESVASAFILLGDFPVAHTVCAAGAVGHLASGVNPFLRWQSFLALMDRGYQENDLTDAALNDVTRFKSQLGGRLELSFELDAPRSPAFLAKARARDRSRRLKGIAKRVLSPGGGGS